MVLWHFILCIFFRLKIDSSVIYKNVKSMCAKVVWKWASVEMKVPIVNDSFCYFLNITHWKKKHFFIWTHANHLHARVLCAHCYFFFLKLLSLYYDWPSIGKRCDFFFWNGLKFRFPKDDLSQVLYKMVMGIFIRRKIRNTFFREIDW